MTEEVLMTRTRLLGLKIKLWFLLRKANLGMWLLAKGLSLLPKTHRSLAHELLSQGICMLPTEEMASWSRLLDAINMHCEISEMTGEPAEARVIVVAPGVKMPKSSRDE